MDNVAFQAPIVYVFLWKNKFFAEKVASCYEHAVFCYDNLALLLHLGA